MSKENVVFSLTSGAISPSFIATADAHLGKKLYNFPELEEDLRDNLTRVAQLAIEKEVEYLIIVGDLFDDNLAKPHIIAFVTRLVEQLKKHDIKIIGIAGDHDKPLKGDCWIRVSGVQPVNIVPEFTGLDYFDYSTVTHEQLVEMLKVDKKPEKVQWIFLHCQFPQLFSRAEPKKLIDFNRLNLFSNFPNLQGIIAGDIHFGPDTTAYGVGHQAYVGYTGSLGQTDIAEAAEFRSVLYCDGKQLIKLPFPQRRRMRKINFRGKACIDFDVEEHIEWAKSQKYKPVFQITWDSNSNSYVHKLTRLYEFGLVKLQQLTVDAEESEETDQVSARSEVTSDDKIDKALRYYCENNEEKYKLASSLIKGEPKDVLDALKKQFNL